MYNKTNREANHFSFPPLLARREVAPERREAQIPFAKSNTL